MNTLVTLNHSLNNDYDWQKIADPNDRTAAQSAVGAYKKEWENLRVKADQLIKDNTIHLARCVYQLKAILPHGEFADVCANLLKINKDKRAALVHVGQQVLNGSQSEEVLEMVQQMDPRAAQKLMKADDETKSRHVANYQSTGQIPSRRDFSQSSPQSEISKPEPIPYVAPTPEELAIKRAGLWEQKDHIYNLVNNKNLSFIDTVEKACLWHRSHGDDLLAVVYEKISKDVYFKAALEAHLEETNAPVIDVSSESAGERPVVFDNVVRNGVRWKR